MTARAQQQRSGRKRRTGREARRFLRRPPCVHRLPVSRGRSGLAMPGERWPPFQAPPNLALSADDGGAPAAHPQCGAQPATWVQVPRSRAGLVAGTHLSLLDRMMIDTGHGTNELAKTAYTTRASTLAMGLSAYAQALVWVMETMETVGTRLLRAYVASTWDLLDMKEIQSGTWDETGGE